MGLFSAAAPPDLTAERPRAHVPEGVVVLVEAKNTKVKDTIIRQLYYPYRKWAKETGKRVIPMFFEKNGDEYMFWMYEFTDPENYNSIRLIRSRRMRVTSN